MNEGLSKNEFCLWESQGKFIRNKKEYKTLKDFIDYILEHERLITGGNYNGEGLKRKYYKYGEVFIYQPISADYDNTENTIKYFMKYCEYDEVDNNIWWRLDNNEKERYRKRSIWYEYLKGLKHKSEARNEDINERVKIYNTTRDIFIDHIDRWKKANDVFSISQIAKKWEWEREYSKINGKGDSIVVIPMNQTTERILDIVNAKGNIDITNTEYKELEIQNSAIYKLDIPIIRKEVKLKTSSFFTNDGVDIVVIRNSEFTDEEFFKKYCNGETKIRNINFYNCIVPKKMVGDCEIKMENTKNEIDLIESSYQLEMEDCKKPIKKIKSNIVSITGDCVIGEIDNYGDSAGEVNISNHFENYSSKIRIDKVKTNKLEVKGCSIRIDELQVKRSAGITVYENEKVQINFKSLSKDTYIYVNVPKSYGLTASNEQEGRYKDLKKVGIDLRLDGKPYNGKLQVYVMKY